MITETVVYYFYDFVVALNYVFTAS